jgi:transcriptional regulator
MYVNPHFAERDLPVLHDAIEATRFGLLVLCADSLLAAHIPFVLHREEGPYGTLFAHVAENDPLARHLGDGREVLAVFGGPRAYVSPRWYAGGGLPTYNYVAVHAYGCPRLVEDRDAVLAHLTELAEAHERGSSDPWRFDEAPTDDLARLLPHLLAFTLPIDAIQGKRKLSQNRSAEDRAGVIDGLRQRGGDDDLVIADTMIGYPYPSSGLGSAG